MSLITHRLYRRFLWKMRTGVEMEVVTEEMGSTTAAHGPKNLQSWLLCPVRLRRRGKVRDRKAFLLHSLFVDVSVFKAISVIKSLVESNDAALRNGPISHEERVGEFWIY